VIWDFGTELSTGDKFMPTPVVKTMSEARFNTYLRAAGFDLPRALEMYLWNAKLGAAFHIVIQGVEVSLRNRIDAALKAEFGSNWWREEVFLQLLPPNMQRDIAVVRQRLGHLKAQQTTDQIVASLSFGFWVGMLHRRFKPRIWTRQIRASFPDLPPQLGRDALHQNAQIIARLRNRISHHEPLVYEDALAHHGVISRVLEWVCAPTRNWILPHCDVPRMIRQKP
jgi:Abi-like protein